MAIDFHTLNFLRWSAAIQPFGQTITLGRQALDVNEITIRRLFPLLERYEHHPFCEELLKMALGATEVSSLDNSGYEGATFEYDLNLPVPDELKGTFDTVLDAGTVEHVYNAPMALYNASVLCRPGGQIIHVLPANNFCGHGFWQFSPELFFSLYSRENGYLATRVFLSDYNERWKWFEVQRPEAGRRVNVSSKSEVYALVRTVRAGEHFSHERVQQSDYLSEWATDKTAVSPFSTAVGLKGYVMRTPLVYDYAFPIYHKIKNYTARHRLSSQHPDLTLFDVRTISRPAETMSSDV